MENKKHMRAAVIIGLAVIIVIAGFIVRSVMNNSKGQGLIPTAVITGTTVAGGSITINNLAQGQTIKTPRTINGVVAKWFFEGSFPVFMKDNLGNQIGVGLATSSQDWMTANPIPFSVTLPAVNYTGQGTLVFTKDNPSDEPQNDDSYTVNVIFQ